jgi:hypothetical protein
MSSVARRPPRSSDLVVRDLTAPDESLTRWFHERNETGRERPKNAKSVIFERFYRPFALTRGRQRL